LSRVSASLSGIEFVRFDLLIGAPLFCFRGFPQMLRRAVYDPTGSRGFLLRRALCGFFCAPEIYQLVHSRP